MFISPVQLTTSRIGNLTRLIHTLLYVMTIHTYISQEEGQKKKKKNDAKFAHVVVYLTLLTGPLRIQLWSQDRGSTKTNRGRTRSGKRQNKIRQTNREESRQKEAGVEVACKGRHRQEGIQEGKHQGTKAK